MNSSNENTTPSVVKNLFEKINIFIFFCQLIQTHGITPEMSEEAKLKAKYGGALPRQQNMLTKKLMSKVIKIIFF